MGKENFFKDYLGEVIFVVWTIAFVLTVHFVDGLNEYLICSVPFIVNILLSWMIAKNLHIWQRVEALKWGELVSSMFMAGVIFRTINLDLIAAIMWGLSCHCLCCMAINRGSRKNLRLAYLSENNRRRYLREKVSLGRQLTDDEEVELLELPNSAAWVGMYTDRYKLSPLAEEKFLEGTRFQSLWSDYFQLYSLYRKVEMELFERPDAKAILSCYCEFNRLRRTTELKLFDMPNPREWVEMYIKGGPFSGEAAEVKLFEMKDADDLKKFYKSTYVLYEATCNMIYR